MHPPRPKIEGWIRELDNDRLELHLRVQRLRGVADRRLRASGPRDEMYELVDWFEKKTGLRVDVPNRQRVERQIEGQMTLVLAGAPTDG